LKHKNTMEITVIPDINGNIIFCTIPSASTPIVAIAGQYQNITLPNYTAGTPLGAPAGTVTASFDAATVSGITETYPGIPWPSWATYFGNLPVSPDLASSAGRGFGPFDYKSQRVASQGLEWRFTGTELSDQGICTAAIVDAYPVEGYSDYMPTTPPATLNPGVVKFTQRADVFTIANITEATLSNMPQFRQQTMHSAEGAGGYSVLISGEEGYALKPTNPLEVLVDTSAHSANFALDALGIATIGATGGTMTLPGLFPMLPWQNLRPIGYAFTGLATGIPIVIRLKQYVEATINPSSSFAQFTDKSPSEDCTALAIVANIQKTLPVMVPVTMNGFGDWWRKIMSMIGSAGRIVSGLGIQPFSAVAGGIAGLTDILGAL